MLHVCITSLQAFILHSSQHLFAVDHSLSLSLNLLSVSASPLYLSLSLLRARADNTYDACPTSLSCCLQPDRSSRPTKMARDGAAALKGSMNSVQKICYFLLAKSSRVFKKSIFLELLLTIDS